MSYCIRLDKGLALLSQVGEGLTLTEGKHMKNYNAILDLVPQAHRIDCHVLAQQIGHANMLAISGGRATNYYQCKILPVNHGYHVVISLNADDTYKVQRVFMRSGKATVKAQWTTVYADQIADVAYQASLMEAVTA